MLVDSHCHIHELDYPIKPASALKTATQAGVGSLICIGTSYLNSKRAIDLANKYRKVYATVGIHPNHFSHGIGKLETLINRSNPKLVAIGEIGLDYHYKGYQSSKQIKLLEAQIELAIKYDLPIVFHVRDAFDDFWPIFNKYKSKVRGVLHSYSDNQVNLQLAIGYGLYIGINGLVTFTKNVTQQTVYRSIPLENLIIETDAPYLTPAPFRGKINEPALVREIADYIGRDRNLSTEIIASATTKNVEKLFNLKLAD